jgi:hypothetical protein
MVKIKICSCWSPNLSLAKFFLMGLPKFLHRFSFWKVWPQWKSRFSEPPDRAGPEWMAPCSHYVARIRAMRNLPSAVMQPVGQWNWLRSAMWLWDVQRWRWILLKVSCCDVRVLAGLCFFWWFRGENMLCLAFGRGFLELEDCNLEVMIALSIHTQVPAPTHCWPYRSYSGLIAKLLVNQGPFIDFFRMVKRGHVLGILPAARVDPELTLPGLLLTTS